MKQYLLFAPFAFVMCFAAGCQPSDTNKGLQERPNTGLPQTDIPVSEISVKTGSVRLRLQKPVSEPRACIFPIRVENGLDAPTSVTMIAFKVTGSGDEAKGNMFAPAAEPGEASEARVIVEGQSCTAFDTLSIPEIRCTSGEKDCSGKVELLNGGGLKFARSG